MDITVWGPMGYILIGLIFDITFQTQLRRQKGYKDEEEGCVSLIVFVWPILAALLVGVGLIWLFAESPMAKRTWRQLKDMWTYWRMLPDERMALKLQRQLEADKQELERMQQKDYTTSARKSARHQREMQAIQQVTALQLQLQEIQQRKHALVEQELEAEKQAKTRSPLQVCDLPSVPSEGMHNQSAVKE